MPPFGQIGIGLVWGSYVVADVGSLAWEWPLVADFDDFAREHPHVANWGKML